MHDPFIDNDRSNDPPVPLTADQLARGSVLSLLLTLATFGALLSFGFAVSGFINLKRAIALNRELAEATAPVMKSLILAIALGGGQLGCAMGMWSWKKWGVFGYVAIGVVLFFLSARTDPQHHFSYGMAGQFFFASPQKANARSERSRRWTVKARDSSPPR